MSNRSIFSLRQKIRNMGTCLSFTANNQYATIPFAPATTGFNISFWIYWYDMRLFSDNERPIQFADSGPTNGFIFSRTSSTKTFNFQVYNGASQTVNIATNIVPRVWTHIALTFAPNNANAYVNSVLVGSDTSCAMTTPTQVRVSASTNYFGGALDELVIHNTTTPWTQQQINDLYTKSQFVSGSSAIYLFNEGSGTTAYDSSGNNNNATITSASYRTLTPEFGTTRNTMSNKFLIKPTSNQSLYFNGSNAFATVPVNPSTTGFNIGIWAQLNTIGSNGGFIQQNNGTTAGFKIMYESGKLQVILYDSSATATITANVNTPNLGFWSHIAVTFAPNDLKVYVNNVLIGNDTSCSMAVPTGKTLTLSRNNDVGSGYINSKMCNFILHNTTTPWTQSEINDLYWRNIIPSGALHWSMNNTNLDQNGQNGLTLTGTTYSSDVPPHMSPRVSLVNYANTVSDNFNDNTDASGIWTASGDATQVKEQNNRTEITHAATVEYNTRYLTLTKNLTDSDFHIKLTDAGNQALTSHEAIFGIQRDSSNKLYFSVSGNTLYAYKVINGAAAVSIGSTAYNSSTHAYLRIRESNGVIFFDTSSDGISYTNRFYLIAPFPIGNVQAYMQSGCWNNEASGSYAYFDDFNG